MDEILRDFLLECHEHLDALDGELVRLEAEPSSPELLAGVFRTFHTIKGAAGCFAYSKLESLTHAAENLLSLLRDEELSLNGEMVTALLATVDAVRAMLASIETDQNDGPDHHPALLATLARLQTGQPAAPEESPPAAPAERAPSDGRGSSVADNSIRVDVGVLDKLMNLVGELVLVRNQVLQFQARRKGAPPLPTDQRLNLITSELQQVVMKTRMQPIGDVWAKFPRLVRDLALACGKDVRIETQGQATEIDKTVLEAIKDPLLHVIRNAVDHGVELPALRLARGKPAQGLIRARAFHEGGYVNIEITDDGGGIDAERIKAKALERGLIDGGQAARMTTGELLNLIFLSGFSTAPAITNLSGRGVGMDVVKTNVEKIGGTVGIDSHPGLGSTIQIKIPLTLAIIPALIVTSNETRYAIPQVSVTELVRLERDGPVGVELIHGWPFIRLRETLLPLVDLEQLLSAPIDRTRSDPPPPVFRQNRAGPTNIVVLRAGDQPFGLVVAGVSDTEDIVVKPLGVHLEGIPIFAGAMIMGDGVVALILDVMGIARCTRVVSLMRGAVDGARARPAPPVEDRPALLLCGVGVSGRMAIPIGLVCRLEQFSASAVEPLGGQMAVRHGAEILPLLDLAQLLPAHQRTLAEGPNAFGGRESVNVVIYSDGQRRVGLVVGRIIDIVTESIAIEPVGARPGVIGVTILQGQLTELIDVVDAIRFIDPTFTISPPDFPGWSEEAQP